MQISVSAGREIHREGSWTKELLYSWSLGPSLVACGSILVPQAWTLLEKGPKNCPLILFLEASLLTESLTNGCFNLQPLSPSWRSRVWDWEFQPSNHMIGSSGSPLPLHGVLKSPSLIIIHPFHFYGSETFSGTVDEDQIYQRNTFRSSEWPDRYFL